MDFVGGIIALSIVLVRALVSLLRGLSTRDRRAAAGRHQTANGGEEGVVLEVGATRGRHRAGNDVGQLVVDEVGDFMESLVQFLKMFMILIVWLGFEAYLAWIWWSGFS